MTRSYVRGTEPERFWPKVNRDGDCWLWTAGTNGADYGIFRRSDGSNVRAHVWSWESENGPVPAGLELDHVCRNSLCVRPSHLEPVTHAENIRRGLAGRLRPESPVCRRGHAWSEHSAPNPNGTRYCRECRRERRSRTRP